VSLLSGVIITATAVGATSRRFMGPPTKIPTKKAMAKRVLVFITSRSSAREPATTIAY
jgi:hypothetical protein